MPVQMFSGEWLAKENKDVFTYHWQYHAPDIAFGDGSIYVTYHNLEKSMILTTEGNIIMTSPFQTSSTQKHYSYILLFPRMKYE